MKKEGNEKVITLDRLKQFKDLMTPELIDMFYPVGSYMDLYTDEITPADLMPNTDWLPITDGTVRRAAGNNSVIGSDTHTLTENEMPGHNHSAETSIFQQCGLVGWNFDNSEEPDNHIADPASGSRPYVYGGSASHPHELNAIHLANTGNSYPHSILQKSQNCYTYRRVSRSNVKEVA